MSEVPLKSKLLYAWQRYADRGKDVIYSSLFKENNYLPLASNENFLTPYHISTWFKAVKQKDDQFLIYKCEYTKVHPAVILPYKTQYTENKLYDDDTTYSRDRTLFIFSMIEKEQKWRAVKPSRLLQRFTKPKLK